MYDPYEDIERELFEEKEEKRKQSLYAESFKIGVNFSTFKKEVSKYLKRRVSEDEFVMLFDDWARFLSTAQEKEKSLTHYCKLFQTNEE